MTTTAFERLCAGLREAGGTSWRETTETALTLDGVDVTVRPVDATDPACAHVRVAFGTLPPERSLHACHALMDMNSLMLWSSGSAFARDASTGEIVLHYAYPMAGGSASDLYANLVELAAIAREWRKHWFLGPSGNSPIGPLVHAVEKMD